MSEWLSTHGTIASSRQCSVDQCNGAILSRNAHGEVTQAGRTCESRRLGRTGRAHCICSYKLLYCRWVHVWIVDLGILAQSQVACTSLSPGVLVVEVKIKIKEE